MKQKKQSGFTLIEVVIAAALTSMLGLALVGLQYIFSQTQLTAVQNYINVDQANSNISTLVREIRNIRAGENAAYPLERAHDQEIIFYSDIDYDGESERVRYTLSGSSLVKGVIDPVGYPPTYPSASEKVRLLTENVRNETDSIFYYYNGDWPADTVNNPLPQPIRLSETKMMKVYLELNTRDAPEDNYILESYVQLRMLKENL